MNYHRQADDTVTVHPNVLRTIIHTAAMSIDGVVRLDRGGMQLQVEEDDIMVQIGLIVDASHNLQTVSHAVQQEVSRMLHEYVGMNVKAVNVHIEDLYV